MRIAVGGFIHETNTFVSRRTRYRDFVQGVPNPPLSMGTELLSNLDGLNIPISGALSVFEANQIDVSPLLWCEAGPSGYVLDAAFDKITSDFLRMLKHTPPLDGLFLDLHGAMVAESFEDGEGEFLKRIRDLVGPDLPIVCALDLHGNITPEMLAHSDYMEACRKYPHTDFFEIGERAAERLVEIVSSGSEPKGALAQLPVLLPMPMQATDLPGPAAIYRNMSEVEQDLNVDCSFCMGFPASDIHHAGASFLVYGDDPKRVDKAVHELDKCFSAHCESFSLEGFEPRAAVRKAIDTKAGPITIADVQDNSGAGASSDSTAMLRALMEEGAKNAVIGLFYDPETALRAHEVGLGITFNAHIGGKYGLPEDEPVLAHVRVNALGDGSFVCQGDFFKGVNPELGPMAALELSSDDYSILVIVASSRCQLADLEMLKCVGVDPLGKDIIVVKSTAHFRADFAPISKEIIIALAPGELNCDAGALDYLNLRPGVARVVEDERGDTNITRKFGANTISAEAR